LPETRFGRATYVINILIIDFRKLFWHTTNGSLSSSVTAAVDGTVEGGVVERDVTTVGCSVWAVFGTRNVCGFVGTSSWCLEDWNR
jgi:hypothetical protein